MAAVELRPGQQGGSDQTLEPWQVDALNQPLNGAKVKTRQKGGQQLSYIEGHEAIRVANAVFGFCGWGRKVNEMRLVADTAYHSKDKDGRQREGFLVAYVAHCTVRAYSPTMQEWVESDGWGYGEGIEYTNVGQAHESAIKEAETDAMKRALARFGDQFGLALYDKQKAHVEKAAPAAGGGAQRAAPPAATAPTSVPAPAQVKREQVAATVAQGRPDPEPLPPEPPDTRPRVSPTALAEIKKAMNAAGCDPDAYKRLRAQYEQPKNAMTHCFVPVVVNMIATQDLKQAELALGIARASGVLVDNAHLTRELVPPTDADLRGEQIGFGEGDDE